ncbi:MAG: DUF4956 domain-containing protein [Prolixibacteraceae bacterium]|jgi:hypothetical protein|nr:DUF4956 domain-containing protein [Prolixibacteraceae bacterium]MBT6765299.1 DUF4956 domain-containing protein [Prolixibacteraceae bacterium]MBT6996913.1 DUF4956 domain-containing protein [Prolixibacteraceae bacterium]MBT7396959.1 DUF4956 domain-containing protein [Prolixibacteraceae bacterium]
MDKWNLFQRFLITENAQISIWDFLINAAIILVLSFLLEFTYSRCAKSLSGRKAFAANFFLIAFTTMLIISIVKSSLALSLGLVGALSIVRFRSAIKEPEELAYLFVTISIGLGLGANQRVITVVAAFVLLAIIWAKYLSSKKTRQQNLYLTVSGVGLNKPALEKIDAIVQQSFKASKLVRYDETSETIETAFWVEIKNTENLQDFKNQLNEINPEIRVSFVDNNSF